MGPSVSIFTVLTLNLSPSETRGLVTGRDRTVTPRHPSHPTEPLSLSDPVARCLPPLATYGPTLKVVVQDARRGLSSRRRKGDRRQNVRPRGPQLPSSGFVGHSHGSPPGFIMSQTRLSPRFLFKERGWVRTEV